MAVTTVIRTLARTITRQTPRLYQNTLWHTWLKKEDKPVESRIIFTAQTSNSYAE